MKSNYETKYLKYKTKYLNLKRLITGGGSIVNDKLSENVRADEELKKRNERKIAEERKIANERKIAEERKIANDRKIAEELKVVEKLKKEADDERELKNELKAKLEGYILKNEDCTAIIFKGNCKKSIVEFNNYIQTEIEVVMSYARDLSLKKLLIIRHLNNLIEAVNNSETKKLITEYRIKRNIKGFIVVEDSLFDTLDEIKKQIVSL
jgi:hypothetical protein